MPITLKDFSWHQNSTSVLLKINTNNVRPSSKNCSVTIASKYLKLSLPPYIFELFLAEPTNFGDAKVTFANNHVAFSLPKLELGKEWQVIENVDLTKEQKQQLRRDAEEEQLEWHKKRESEIQEKNNELCKKNVDEQLKQMEENRQRVERVKKEIVKQALEDTLHWKQTLPDENESKKTQGEVVKPEGKSSGVTIQIKNDEDIENPEEPLELSVSFTPRIFPTPKRESHEPMEQKWMHERKEAMKLAGVSPEMADNSEPGWMYEKARELVESGNYQGAAAVASHALSTRPWHGGLRLVLAAAYLHLGHWYQAIECCSRALENTTLENDMRAKLVALRGVALRRSGRQKEGAMEIKLSLPQFTMDSLLATFSSEFTNN